MTLIYKDHKKTIFLGNTRNKYITRNLIARGSDVQAWTDMVRYQDLKILFST